MTNRGASANKKRATRQDFGVDFLRIYLGKQEKAEIAAQDWKMEDTTHAVVSWVEAGYKVSLTYNEKNDSFICTLTSPTIPETGRKVGVSSFAPSVEEAVQVAWYKWSVVTEGGQWSLYDAQEGFDRYG